MCIRRPAITSTQTFDIIILGAGAAGLFCAANIKGKRVLVIDHAEKAAEKVRISGGGRCNFTNIHTTPANFISNDPAFCVSALKRYGPKDFIKLVDSYRIAHHQKTLGQLFCDGSSQQIIDMLLLECNKAGVQIALSTSISTVEKTSTGFRLQSSMGELICTSLVIATGGLSIPKMGATGFGYDIAKQFGLNIIPTRAALVPFTFDGAEKERMAALTGISLDIIATCNNVSFREAMLFTHRGISGPAILQISSYWKSGDSISLNLAPDIDMLAALKAAQAASSKQAPTTALAQHMPKRLAEQITTQLQLPFNLAEMGKAKFQALTDAVQNWRITPHDTEGYRTAEVTAGGVDTAELSPDTMEANKQAGLYFIGEVVDVTGHLGGFNFQWAWASAMACAVALTR